MSGNATLSFQQDIPVRHEVDVCVVGGGPAGIAAAITAARQGRSVFLAEEQACLGGMGTAGLVPWFCGYHDGERVIAEGVWREVRTRLIEADGAGLQAKLEDDRSRVHIHPETLKRVYDAMVVDAGVRFAFLTRFVGVTGEGGRVTHAFFAAKSGMFAVQASFFIDATGDGDLAAWAGAPFAKGDTDGSMMPGTLCSDWTDIDWERAEAQPTEKAEALERAIADGVFTIPDRHVSGIARHGAHTGGGNIGHTYGVDATDERSVTEALVWGRKLALEFRRFYREYMNGFEAMELTQTGALLGLRESRRIAGEYELVLDDFESRRSFADEIGRCAYWIDQHASSPDRNDEFEEKARRYRLPPGESFGIPYRCLLPQTLRNVLVAGRCISANRLMQSSIRVMPICCVTGQAAGMAAAVATEKRLALRDIEVPELQKRLEAIGAYLRPDG